MRCVCNVQHLDLQPRRTVSVPSRKGRLVSLRNTWWEQQHCHYHYYHYHHYHYHYHHDHCHRWVRVEPGARKQSLLAPEELRKETPLTHTPLYHNYRNNTAENSFWENHCSLHWAGSLSSQSSITCLQTPYFHHIMSSPTLWFPTYSKVFRLHYRHHSQQSSFVNPILCSWHLTETVLSAKFFFQSWNMFN